MYKKSDPHLLQEVVSIFRARSTTNQLIGGMNEIEFETIREKIYNWTGIYFLDEKKYLLEARIVKRLTMLQYTTFKEYAKQLENETFLETELPFLYTAITINETYFFRCMEHLDSIQNFIIPELVREKNLHSKEKKIKFWSAACSSGEEAYTLAIIIKEEIAPHYPDFEFEIIASDIDTSILSKAKTGLFTEYSIRHIPAVYFQKYFSKQGSQYKIDDEIVQMVRFFSMNLYNEIEWKEVHNIDCVFCCNVMIYFDQESKKKVLLRIYDSLEQVGYLFVGYSESLFGIENPFSRNYMLKSLGYKKEERNRLKKQRAEEFV